MKTLQFTNGIDPGVVEVLSPISGQRAHIHRAPMTGSSRRIALFPGEGGQVIKVPQLGYTLEAMAFGVCGIASFALILMLLLNVR
jgi:hypothetical protein